jgi:hypothetical protein
MKVYTDLVDGDQNFFPVYEPDPDALRRKYLAAEEEARAHHYDSTKEGKSSSPYPPSIVRRPYTMFSSRVTAYLHTPSSLDSN